MTSEDTDQERSEAGRALSRLGASKGGKARAFSLTPEDRSKIARRAVEARWFKAGKTPSVHQATHSGTLKLGGLELDCAVLEDGTRVLSERGFMRGLGIKFGGPLYAESRGVDGAVPVPMFVGYRRLRPFIGHDLTVLLQNPVKYRAIPGGKPAHGLRAELIPGVCEVWLKARNAGELQTNRQRAIAAKADILVRGLSHVGIVALVDEATGYQDARAKDALAKILEAFVAKELRKWVKTFPLDYFKELCRLKKWTFSATMKLPLYSGKLTNDLIYSRLAPGVLAKLRQKNPITEAGTRKHRHHQWLTDNVGHPALREHLAAVIALMRVSDNWDAFYDMLNKALKQYVAMPLFEGPVDDSTSSQEPQTASAGVSLP